MLPIKFRFICLSGFREEDYLEIDQSETIMSYSGHAFQIGTRQNEDFIEDLP